MLYLASRPVCQHINLGHSAVVKLGETVTQVSELHTWKRSSGIASNSNCFRVSAHGEQLWLRSSMNRRTTSVQGSVCAPLGALCFDVPFCSQRPLPSKTSSGLKLTGGLEKLVASGLFWCAKTVPCGVAVVCQNDSEKCVRSWQLWGKWCGCGGEVAWQLCVRWCVRWCGRWSLKWRGSA